MNNQSVKHRSECRILVVDDEKAICDFLCGILEDTYQVDTCLTASEAFARIRAHDYDVVVTDLRLPDDSGIEVLRAAKAKDEHTEVIIITGFASLESAAEAINLGVTSYLIKPLQMEGLLSQVDRAVSSRMFHLKSLRFMRHPNEVPTEVKDHLHDITALYFFSRKLMLTLEIAEIMRIILDEANTRMGAVFSLVAVDFLQFTEAYAMPRAGQLDADTVRAALMEHWESLPRLLDRDRVESGEMPLTVYGGKHLAGQEEGWGRPWCVPLSVLGGRIGFLALFCPAGVESEPGKVQFLHVFTSMVSSIIEHGYLDMQAKLLAKTDSLTGIGNHRMFHEAIEKEIARANRHGRAFSLALVDIDDFKKVNDTYGHLIGDAVLKALTKRISGVVRLGDVVARYGGEEFALILPDTDLPGARILADRVLKAVADPPIIVPKHSLVVTVSIGVAGYAGSSQRDKDALIGEADEALYESKRSGKNRVTVR